MASVKSRILQFQQIDAAAASPLININSSGSPQNNSNSPSPTKVNNHIVTSSNQGKDSTNEGNNTDHLLFNNNNNNNNSVEIGDKNNIEHVNGDCPGTIKLTPTNCEAMMNSAHIASSGGCRNNKSTTTTKKIVTNTSITTVVNNSKNTSAAYSPTKMEEKLVQKSGKNCSNSSSTYLHKNNISTGSNDPVITFGPNKKSTLNINLNSTSVVGSSDKCSPEMSSKPQFPPKSCIPTNCRSFGSPGNNSHRIPSRQSPSALNANKTFGNYTSNGRFYDGMGWKQKYEESEKKRNHIVSLAQKGMHTIFMQRNLCSIV